MTDGIKHGNITLMPVEYDLGPWPYCNGFAVLSNLRDDLDFFAAFRTKLTKTRNGWVIHNGGNYPMCFSYYVDGEYVRKSWDGKLMRQET